MQFISFNVISSLFNYNFVLVNIFLHQTICIEIFAKFKMNIIYINVNLIMTILYYIPDLLGQSSQPGEKPLQSATFLYLSLMLLTLSTCLHLIWFSLQHHSSLGLINLSFCQNNILVELTFALSLLLGLNSQM